MPHLTNTPMSFEQRPGRETVMPHPLPRLASAAIGAITAELPAGSRLLLLIEGPPCKCCGRGDFVVAASEGFPIEDAAHVCAHAIEHLIHADTKELR